MKQSKHWLRRKELENNFKALLDDGASLDDLTGYEAAKCLGVDPGGEFYRKFNEWKEAEKAKEAGGSIVVPGEVLQAFREQIDAFQEQAEAAFIDACRNLAGEIEARARQEVSSAQQRAARSDNEVGGLIDRLCETERARDVAEQTVAELTTRLDAADAEIINLKAKLVAKDDLLDQLMAKISLAENTARLEPAPAEAEPSRPAQADVQEQGREGNADPNQQLPLADPVSSRAAPSGEEADDGQA